jgi:hypothetical protein
MSPRPVLDARINQSNAATLKRLDELVFQVDWHGDQIDTFLQ